jgi:hypothetical protein
MKTSNGHTWADPFDTVFDSMGAASGATGIPLQILKEMKRRGCDAVKGSRVHLGKLRAAITSTQEEPPGLCDSLLDITERVARTVASKLLEHDDRTFRDDCVKITQQIQLGLGLVACVLDDPGSADDFLRESANVMESIFKSTRKSCHDSISKSNHRRRKNERC